MYTGDRETDGRMCQSLILNRGGATSVGECKSAVQGLLLSAACSVLEPE